VKKMIRLAVILGMVVALAGFMTVGPAAAQPVLDVNGVPVALTFVAGTTYSFVAVAGGATFSGSVESNPPSGSPLLDQVTLQVVGKTVGAVDFQLSDVGFSTPGAVYSLAATELSTGSVTGKAYYSTTNNTFAEDHQIGSTLTLNSVIPPAVSYNTSGAIVGSPDSLTLDLSFAIGTSNASLTESLDPVPEPATLFLIGGAVVGWGVLRSLRKKS